MQFQIPQFIEKETKIVGPLSFRQFIFVGIAGTIIFLLYFTLAKTNLLLFLLIAIILTGTSLVLSFVTVAGRSLPIVVANFFIYLLSSRIYLWKKKQIAPRLVEIKRKPEREKEKELPALKFVEKSQLKKLSTQIETKAK